MNAHRRAGGGDPAAAGDKVAAGARAAARVLAIDVGTGTCDILLTLTGETLKNAVKLVVPSRTQVVAAQIAQATARGQTVVFRGPVMGGGPDGAAMKAHLRAGCAFVATESAALSFADDLDKTRALGARVVGERAGAEMLQRLPDGVAVEIVSGDLEPAALRRALDLLGTPPRWDGVALAVQDHGFNPRGSNRVTRFALWEAAVSAGRRIDDLFYAAADVPATLTRLRAAATLGAELAQGVPVLVADTGPAALYGALPAGVDDAILVNVGNGHTICVITLNGRLAGVFEHHTRLLDPAGLNERLRRFLAGRLTSAEVREDGGHGAVLPAAAPAGLPLYATGPRRELLAGSTLPFEFAAPHGDMMLTGCFGLLRAFEERGVAP